MAVKEFVQLPSSMLSVTPPPITHLIALGGVVYVATSMNVYRVEGDELVRLRWPGEKQEA